MSALARRVARLLHTIAGRLDPPDYLAMVHPLPPATPPADGWGGVGPQPCHVPDPPAGLPVSALPERRVLSEPPPGNVDRRRHPTHTGEPLAWASRTSPRRDAP